MDSNKGLQLKKRDLDKLFELIKDHVGYNSNGEIDKIKEGHDKEVAAIISKYTDNLIEEELTLEFLINTFPNQAHFEREFCMDIIHGNSDNAGKPFKHFKYSEYLAKNIRKKEVSKENHVPKIYDASPSVFNEEFTQMLEFAQLAGKNGVKGEGLESLYKEWLENEQETEKETFKEET